MDFTATFKIGEAFPAEDATARFVTMLAVICNDAVRTAIAMAEIRQNDESPEARAQNVRLFRALAAALFEAVDFLEKAQKHNYAAITRLLSRSPEAQVKLARVLGTSDPNSEHYLGDWFRSHRHITFHYANVVPAAAEHGREEVFRALTAAADETSTIDASGERLHNLRFWFADQVVLEWLPPYDEQEETLAGMMTVNAELADFTQFAMAEYLRSLPPGVVAYDAEPQPPA